MVSVISETGTTRSFKQITEKKKKKNKTGSLLHAIYKKQCPRDYRPKCKKHNYKVFTTEYRRIPQWGFLLSSQTALNKNAAMWKLRISVHQRHYEESEKAHKNERRHLHYIKPLNN